MGILKSLSPVLIFLLLLDHNTHRYSADTCLFPPSPSPPPPMSSHSTDKPFPAKHRWREKLYFSNPAFSSSLFCPPPAVTKGKGKKSGRERRKKKHFSFQFLLLRVQAGPRLRTKEKKPKKVISSSTGEKKVVASSEFCAAYACTRDSRHREEGRRRHRYCVGRIISKVKNRSSFSLLTHISPREKPSWLAVKGPCFSLEMKMKEIFLFIFHSRNGSYPGIFGDKRRRNVLRMFHRCGHFLLLPFS